MFFRYYALAPINTRKITIGHACAMGQQGAVRGDIKLFGKSGVLLKSKDFEASYPLFLSLEDMLQDLKEDSYFAISILSATTGKSVPGAIDVFYGENAGIYGVGTSGVTDRANHKDRPSFQGSILKNNLVVSSVHNTVIYTLNPNPLLNSDTQKDGEISYRVLTPAGKEVLKNTIKVQSGEMKIIDIAAELPKDFSKHPEPQFLTFIAQTNFNVFPLEFNSIRGKFTGCEHSQPKVGYYRVSEPQRRTVNVMRVWGHRIAERLF